MSETPLLVAAVGLSEPDARLLTATLSTLCIRTDAAWKLARDAPGEILVVDLSHPEGAAAFAQRGISPDKVFIVLGGALPGGAPDPQVLPLATPIQAQDLYGALESAAARLRADDKAGSLPSQPVTTLADALYDMLQQADRMRVMQITDVEEGGTIFVFFPERIFFLEGRLSSVHGTERVCVVEAPRDDDDVAMTARLAMAQPLMRLLVLAGLSNSKGTLLPQLDPAMAYRLNRWPTMEMLGAVPSLLKVSAYLIKRAGTVQEMTARTGLLPEAVADALNACALNGYLETVPRERAVEQSPAQPPVKQAATKAKLGLFQRIRAKLGLATAEPASDG